MQPEVVALRASTWEMERELAQLKASLKQVQTQVKLDKIAEFTDSMGLFQADASKKVEALAAVHAETQVAIAPNPNPNPDLNPNPHLHRTQPCPSPSPSPGLDLHKQEEEEKAEGARRRRRGGRGRRGEP